MFVCSYLVLGVELLRAMEIERNVLGNLGLGSKAPADDSRTRCAAPSSRTSPQLAWPSILNPKL